jgi:protein-tyrosine phosphatase
MIDIHSHILPFIDDGSNSFEESFRMIEKAISIGITDIILTPHALRKNINSYTKQSLIDNFTNFKDQVKTKYNINLYLGQEISYNRKLISILKNDELLSMNFSKYILLELPFSGEIEDFEEFIYSCNIIGYQVIIAHIERYDYLTFAKVLEYKDNKVLFQVNSNSITGKSKGRQKLVFKLFKKGLVDLVGSDIHQFRDYDLDEAYTIISKKFGDIIAKKIFIDNPKELFNIK